MIINITNENPKDIIPIEDIDFYNTRSIPGKIGMLNEECYFRLIHQTYPNRIKRTSNKYNG